MPNHGSSALAVLWKKENRRMRTREKPDMTRHDKTRQDRKGQEDRTGHAQKVRTEDHARGGQTGRADDHENFAKDDVVALAPGVPTGASALSTDQTSKELRALTKKQ
jgi:hypothetical protein